MKRGPKGKVERNARILKEYKAGKKGYKKLAKDYGIHYTTVANIIKRVGKLSTS